MEISLSPKPNPLRHNHLADTLASPMADSASIRARARIRSEMEKRHLSQRDVAGILEWTQSRVSKNLNARVELGVDDLESLCFAVGITLTEAVRDHGLEFCAEMTPHELRILERIRQLRADVLDAVMTLIQVNTTTRNETRGVTKSRTSKLHKGRL